LSPTKKEAGWNKIWNYKQRERHEDTGRGRKSGDGRKAKQRIGNNEFGAHISQEMRGKLGKHADVDRRAKYFMFG
jgi:hypothetical protein